MIRHVYIYSDAVNTQISAVWSGWNSVLSIYWFLLLLPCALVTILDCSRCFLAADLLHNYNNRWTCTVTDMETVIWLLRGQWVSSHHCILVCLFMSQSFIYLLSFYEQIFICNCGTKWPLQIIQMLCTDTVYTCPHPHTPPSWTAWP